MIVVDVQWLLTEFFDPAVEPSLDRVLPHITQFLAEARRVGTTVGRQLELAGRHVTLHRIFVDLAGEVLCRLRRLVVTSVHAAER